MNVKVTMLVSL